LIKYLLIIIIFLSGCAGTPINHKLSPEVIAQMNKIYDPIKEKAFCVSDVVYNVLLGGWTSCPMPLCEKDSIVFHTHPFWAEHGANFVDLSVWKEYHKRYGNTLYGVMYGIGKYKIYKINP
jgi:hypothetical protein